MFTARDVGNIEARGSRLVWAELARYLTHLTRTYKVSGQEAGIWSRAWAWMEELIQERIVFLQDMRGNVTNTIRIIQRKIVLITVACGLGMVEHFCVLIAWEPRQEIMGPRLAWVV